MTRTSGVHILALLSVLLAGDHGAVAQTRPDDAAALRASVERRFDVIPLRDGVALRPKDSTSGVRSIEVTQGPIVVDGQPATGAELRQKLGADADLVIDLSYLSADDRRALFSSGQSPALAEPPRQNRNPDRIQRRSRGGRGSDKIRIGSSVSVAENESVDGDVVAVGGSATVDGEVNGDVVAVGGSVTLGPNASVSNNVVVVGGTLRREPTSRIGGRVQEVGLGNLDLANWRWSANPLWRYWRSTFGSVFVIVGTLSHLAILCLLSTLVILVGPAYARGAGLRAAEEPLKSGAIGFLAQVLFLPVLVIASVVLVMTVVGIPLLLLIPFLMLGLALVGLVGFTGVAERLGAAVGSRFGWSLDSSYAITIVGIVALHAPALVAGFVGLGGVMVPVTVGLGLLGALVQYLAWTVGFGAVALARFNRTPVPVPAAGSADVPA